MTDNEYEKILKYQNTLYLTQDELFTMLKNHFDTCNEDIDFDLKLEMNDENPFFKLIYKKEILGVEIKEGLVQKLYFDDLEEILASYFEKEGFTINSVYQISSTKNPNEFMLMICYIKTSQMIAKDNSKTRKLDNKSN